MVKGNIAICSVKLKNKYIKSYELYYSDNGILIFFYSKISEGYIVENFVVSEI
jgi:hypothetical protein